MKEKLAFEDLPKQV
jgi:hypothetical protein